MRAWLLADRQGSLRLVTDNGVEKDLIAYNGFGLTTCESGASWGGQY